MIKRNCHTAYGNSTMMNNNQTKDEKTKVSGNEGKIDMQDILDKSVIVETEQKKNYYRYGKNMIGLSTLYPPSLISGYSVLLFSKLPNAFSTSSKVRPIPI
ncbi:hypothetical protein RYX36_019867, partial [Vicia faba]